MKERPCNKSTSVASAGTPKVNQIRSPMVARKPAVNSCEREHEQKRNQFKLMNIFREEIP